MGVMYDVLLFIWLIVWLSAIFWQGAKFERKGRVFDSVIFLEEV